MRTNASEVARIFAVNRGTVTAWMDAGCPTIERGGRGQESVLETAEVHRWLVERAVAKVMPDPDDEPDNNGAALSFDHARARKTQAEAELAELKLEEARGNMVRVDEAIRVVMDAYTAVRAKLLALPVKLAVKVAATRSREDAKAIITEGINEVLTELVFDARKARRSALEDEDETEEGDGA